MSLISYSVLLLLQPLFIISGIGSVLIGTFSALYQIRIKRFLACSSIAQIGLLLLGVSTYSLNGFLGSFIHLFIYSIVNILFFFIIINTNNLFLKRNAIYLHELSLFRKYNPESSYLLSFSVLTMAAFPPFGSFISKVFIFLSLLECKLDLLVLILLILNVISTIYYIRFTQDIFFFNTSTFDSLKVHYLFFLENFNLYLKILFKSFIFIIVFLSFFLYYYYSYIICLVISCIFPFIYF